MPYIKQEAREKFEKFLSELKTETLSPGDLNYIITKILDSWLHVDGEAPTYADFNSAIGVLECAKLELYRRKIAPYEDKKATQNGDVYTQMHIH